MEMDYMFQYLQKRKAHLGHSYNLHFQEKQNSALQTLNQGDRVLSTMTTAVPARGIWIRIYKGNMNASTRAT
jgi:hypothetical protein